MGHLVIGVGGTGFKALSILKAQLLESSSRGELPAGVALRAIDTEHSDDAIKKKASEIAAIGGVPLDEQEEYIWLGDNPPPIGANLYPVGVALDTGGLPAGPAGQVNRTQVDHFTAWFQAHTMRQLLMPAMWNVNVGAGMQRQIARLALFWNVQSPQISPFHRKLMRGITAAATADNDLNVYLVGSTVGGTGAGLFVDVAYLVRRLKPGNVTATITGFLLLPECFSKVLADQALPQAQARTFACLREMQRFSVGMMDLDQSIGFKIVYNPTSPNEAYRGPQHGVTEKLLDAVYYVDGASTVTMNGKPVTLNSLAPDQGTIPLLADALLALLSESGPSRRAHMVNVASVHLGGQIGHGDQKVLRSLSRDFSSSLGTYSIALPIAQVIDALSWRLVKETATLLATQLPDQIGLMSNNRPGGAAGGSVVVHFCALGPVSGQHRNPETQQLETHQAGSSDLLQDIRDRGGDYGDGSNATAARNAATAILGRSLGVWQTILTLPGSAEGQRLEAAWDAELAQKNFVPPKPNLPALALAKAERGQDCKSAWPSLRATIDQEVLNILGTFSVTSGSYSGGTLQALINRTRPELLGVIRRRLWVTALNIMNGQLPADPNDATQVEQSRGNSLGYLSHFLTTLSGLLRGYQGAVTMAQQIRNAAGGKKAQVEANYKKVIAEGEDNPCPGLLGGGAEGLRKRLLQAAQERLDLQRTEAIERMVLDVTATLDKEVQGLRESVQQWGRNLSTGGAKAAAQYAQHEETRATTAGSEADSPLREKIWNADYNNKLYSRYSGTGPHAVAMKLDWWLAEPGKDVQTNFELRLYQGTTRYVDGVTASSGLQRLARSVFDLTWERESILSFLEDHRHEPDYDPSAVGLRLITNSRVAIAAGNAGTPSGYIVLPKGTNQLTQQYRDDLLQEVQGEPADPLKPDIEGKNRFQITYIAWLDLIGVNMLNSFQAAEPQYYIYLSRFQYSDPNNPTIFTRETLQGLPGEVQAVGIEARLTQVQVPGFLPLVSAGQKRRLNYQVIQQLESLDEVRKFLLAWTWKVVDIRSQRHDNQPVVVYSFEIDAPDVVSGPARTALMLEYWLTEPQLQGGAGPSILEALWNWNYKRVDKHPEGYDQGYGDPPQPRPRPNGPIDADIIALVMAKTELHRSQLLQKWLADHENWLTEASAPDQALYQRVPAEQQKRAAQAWAETKYLRERLRDLRLQEKVADDANDDKERDAIAMLMVLLWDSILQINKSWHAEISS